MQLTVRITLILVTLLFFLPLFAGNISSKAANAVTHAANDSRTSRNQPVDYVDPNIGGIGHLLTSLSPDVQQPHGLITVSPVVAPDVTDIYLAQRVLGFSAGNSILTPIPREAIDNKSYALAIDHDRERVTPYYAEYNLAPDGIRAEYTTSQKAMFFRFTFRTETAVAIRIQAADSAEYTVHGNVLSAIEEQYGVRTYLYGEFSRDPESVTTLENARSFTASGKAATLLLNYPSDPRAVQLRIGFSYISIDQARKNLQREIPDWNFESTTGKARNAWNAALSLIIVKGGTEDQRTIFYTALYRSLQYMKDATEDDQYLGPFDHTVHRAHGHRFYIEDNLWDTYRSRHPLQLLIEPERYPDVLWSYVQMYEESGWMPHFPYMDGDRRFMIGNHAAAIFADAYFKGVRGFDVEKAYEGLRKNSLEGTMIPYRHGPATELDRFYDEHGFFPALDEGEKESIPEVDPAMRRQAVSVTLENSYDDWAISELARALGKQDDTKLFNHRAQNYRNVFNAQTGFMAPRNSKGEWVKNFNPKWGGGQAGRDYFTECNGLVYAFQVQQDIPGLIDLMGGRDKFIARLDDLFSEGYDGRLKFEFLAQFPDSTALIGQYPQGNEPSFHIPYLYNYAGAPWKTQKQVREIMQVWYAAQPLGLPGDDDNGATTSWYVFSAMGFYPVTPGLPVYDIGSPIFTETRIRLKFGKAFRIVAHNVSAANKYIQAATLNGHSLDGPWFSHADVMNGGSLVLEMGPRPNKVWGKRKTTMAHVSKSHQTPKYRLAPQQSSSRKHGILEAGISA